MSYRIVIPAAGSSARFAHRTRLPKGLVRFDFMGRGVATMIEHCVPCEEAIVVCRSESYDVFRDRLPLRFEVIPINYTEGQADTVTQLQTLDTPVVVINSDNAFPSLSIESFLSQCDLHDFGVAVFQADGDHYGFVDRIPFPTRGVEKIRISDWALAGMFYFHRIDKLRDKVRRMRKIRDEVYLSSVFETLTDGIAVPISRNDLHAWGTAEDLESDPKVSEIEWE